MTLIDIASAGERRAPWANIDVALLIEDEVGSAEGAIVTCRLVPHRNVRCDLAIYQPLEQPYRTISGVAREPLRLEIEAAPDPVHHGLRNGNLHDAIGAGALGIDDDPDLVVDQIVHIVGKEWVHAWPGNPCRLRIGQRDFGRVAATAAAARSATIPVTRWEHEHVLEAAQRRLDENPQAMRQRRETVEHPFGTLKMRMGATHFLMKRLPKVATEMALHVLAYNLTRVMNIVGVKPLLVAIRA